MIVVAVQDSVSGKTRVARVDLSKAQVEAFGSATIPAAAQTAALSIVDVKGLAETLEIFDPLWSEIIGDNFLGEKSERITGD